MTLDAYASLSYAKINSKWIKDLIIGAKDHKTLKREHKDKIFMTLDLAMDS